MMRIALVSAAAARELDEDLEPLLAAFRDCGADPEVVDWDDPGIDWSAFDVALLRSTWDYTGRLQQFLAWVDAVAARTLLLNPPSLIRWSSDKHYLRDLHEQGIAIVPSRFVEPGDDAFLALKSCLDACPEARDIVVKPCVGAGSRDARRHRREHVDQATVHLQSLLDDGRSVLLQPYLARVDAHGETALIFFDGRYSHAIRKGPLLRADEESTAGLFAPEEISAREPDDAEMELATRVVAAIGGGSPAPYARIDLIRDDNGLPCVLELELVEPSLFFAHAAGSASSFARVVLQHAALRANSPSCVA